MVLLHLCDIVWRQLSLRFWRTALLYAFFILGGCYMEQQKIQLFLMSNQKKFDTAQISIIAEKLQQLEDDKLLLISSAQYKEPTTILILSLFFGGFGIDRFVLGDTKIGVLKLLTGGCLGVLTIIDWFTIMSKTRQKNFEIFLEAINMQNASKTQAQNLQISNTSSNIEKIKKLKQLLDAKIITEEEFEKKKKELL